MNAWIQGKKKSNFILLSSDPNKTLRYFEERRKKRSIDTLAIEGVISFRRQLEGGPSIESPWKDLHAPGRTVEDQHHHRGLDGLIWMSPISRSLVSASSLNFFSPFLFLSHTRAAVLPPLLINLPISRLSLVHFSPVVRDRDISRSRWVKEEERECERERERERESSKDARREMREKGTMGCSALKLNCLHAEKRFCFKRTGVGGLV